ncbi:MAG: glycosyltransferase family 2 protein [Candidatus Omnitrophica bacterium]|nr:glycosyltransferase family 2 protein [Candidatus Omnitrophota bacterium]
MDRLGEPYEIIFVNDCSNDSSLEVLNCLDSQSSSLTIVNLKEHSGQSIALQAGFDIARGELIVMMDSDYQNDPEDIPNLLEKMKENYDVVCGWRYKRKDPFSKLFVSRISWLARRIIFNEKIYDPGCSLRVFKRDVIKNISLFKGAHRFFTLIALRQGYKIAEIKVGHYPRRYGKSKYNIRNRLVDSIVVFIKFLLFDVNVLMKKKRDKRDNFV